MKKTICVLLLNVITLTSFAQSELVIFNGESVTPNWFTVGSAGSIDIYDNPETTGVNSTAKCVTIYRNASDDVWTGGGIGGLSIDPAQYNKISLMVLKNVEGPVQVELQNGSGTSTYIQQPFTTPGKWQELEFDIPSNFTSVITTMLVAPHLENTSGTGFIGERMYWDQIIAISSASSGIESEFDSNEIISTSIYSMTGECIAKLEKGQSLNSITCPKGVYILKQTDVNSNIHTQKVAKKITQ